MKRKINVAFLLLLLLALAACQTAAPAPEATVRDLLLSFFAIVKEAPENEMQFEIGVNGLTAVPADESFSGIWELRNAAGELRSAGEIFNLPAFSGENVLATWQGELEPGWYELTWGAPAYGGVVKLFEVVEENGRFSLGMRQYEFITTNYPPEMPPDMRTQ
jgi:hypothetical protein